MKWVIKINKTEQRIEQKTNSQDLNIESSNEGHEVIRQEDRQDWGKHREQGRADETDKRQIWREEQAGGKTRRAGQGYNELDAPCISGVQEQSKLQKHKTPQFKPAYINPT